FVIDAGDQVAVVLECAGGARDRSAAIGVEIDAADEIGGVAVVFVHNEIIHGSAIREAGARDAVGRPYFCRLKRPTKFVNLRQAQSRWKGKTMYMPRYLIALIIVLAHVGAATAQVQPAFRPLGYLPGGGSESVATGVSADGRFVVGYSRSA